MPSCSSSAAKKFWKFCRERTDGTSPEARVLYRGMRLRERKTWLLKATRFGGVPSELSKSVTNFFCVSFDHNTKMIQGYNQPDIVQLPAFNSATGCSFCLLVATGSWTRQWTPPSIASYNWLVRIHTYLRSLVSSYES